MSGYIFALGSKAGAFATYERCVQEGVYSTNMSTISSIPFEGTLADYLTMQDGDNIYFFFSRKIYGVGTIRKVGFDCKYCNYPLSCLQKNFSYSDIKSDLLVDYGSESANNRWICLFEPSPHFYRKGVDMDDVLTYKPNTFKSLRAFWKTSFIKIGEDENQSLKEIIMLRNKNSFNNPSSGNTIKTSLSLHELIKSKTSNDYVIQLKGLLDGCSNDTHIKHEMAIEAATLNRIMKDSTIFGHWDHLFHQVPASPFKPIDYMDKIDIFGYKFLKDTNIISKYLVIEIKKDCADIDAVSQVAKYVDWVCKEYAFGDYSAVEGMC